MKRSKRLKYIAEKIVGWKAKEITNKFNYFIKRTMRENPSEVTNILAGLFYSWLPQTNKNSIIYIPKFFLHFPRLYLNFLVHELLHDKYPEKSEQTIIKETNRRLRYWK